MSTKNTFLFFFSTYYFFSFAEEIWVLSKSPVAVKLRAKEEFFPIVINFVLQKFPKEKKGKIHKKLRSAYVIS